VVSAKRSTTSTRSCARARRRTSRRRARRSTGCSSTRSATTSVGSAGTRSTCASRTLPAARPGPADRRRHGPHADGLRRDHPRPGRAARGTRVHGRHRPPRQPPGAFDRRADRQPVLDRPVADGAAGAGADVDQQRPGQDVDRRPGQRADGERRDPGVLRQLAAQPVHGPDEPAGGAHAQAAPQRPRARRPEPRARRLRGARRPLFALRTDVPDRDAGRSEHRADHLDDDVLAAQRARVPRDAVPAGRGRHRDGRNRLAERVRGGGFRGRPGERAGQRGRKLRPRPRALPAARRLSASAARGHRVHGRGARPAGRGVAGVDPVPRARRRESRPDGLEHAAAGGSAPVPRRAAGRYGPRREGRVGFGRRARRPARRNGREGDGRGDRGRHRSAKAGGQGRAPRPAVAVRPLPSRSSGAPTRTRRSTSGRSSPWATKSSSGRCWPTEPEPTWGRSPSAGT
jgi:hypothetical protein